MQLTEIRIAGFGGQGVILSAMILGKAASIYQDGFATMSGTRFDKVDGPFIFRAPLPLNDFVLRLVDLNKRPRW